jgi:hypothetical protein
MLAAKLSGMANEPKRSRGRPKNPEGTPKKPRGPVLFIQLTAAEEAALQAYLASLDIPPDRSAVGRRGLHELLAKRGFWPYTPPAAK